MTDAQRTLRRLIADGIYVTDPAVLADAILARGQARATVARVGFHSDRPSPGVRSFRRDPSARSFRLQRTASLHRHRR